MRYLPQTNAARKEMMDSIGVKNVDDLFIQVPKKAFIKGKTNLPDHQGELQIERKMLAYANQNINAQSNRFFLGAGVYYHHVPSSVDYIIQRSEFLTAYTPYQPEIAQGTLQYLFEFQTFIAQLTGQEVANASLYDGATAMAEAALMAMRVTRRNKICFGNDIHPQYCEVTETYLKNNDGNSYTVTEDPSKITDDTACVIIQSPDFYGKPHSYSDWRKACDEKGALLVVVINEIVSLGMLAPPTEADIVCGEAQSIGVAMSYGGPHLGFFACREKFIRQMPGRVCGETVDADGNRGFVLTLSTREQHIRREKATSNICTNQGLCALAFTVHMALLGENGFKQLAVLNHERACELADALIAIDGVSLKNQHFFNELALQLPQGKNAGDIVQQLADDYGIIAGYPADDRTILITATEITTDNGIKALANALQEVL
ncbi:MAG: aminomethyl-transferring glycine dehydrogenase subunit GcvPA [Alphaproteobacteria bacterium]|nr:aminomethyl-transferring glycine dehydrogenase subunit GcvPA [Alphaproteobacteria bacterium]